MTGGAHLDMARETRTKPEDDDLPTCVVCMDWLGTNGGPASFPCGHNGCLKCLQTVLKHSKQPMCPLCRTQFDSELVLGLNLELKGALERVQMSTHVESFLEADTYPVVQSLSCSYKSRVPLAGKDADNLFVSDQSPRIKEDVWAPVSVPPRNAKRVFPIDDGMTQARQNGVLSQRSQGPEVNAWNVLGGLFTILTGRGQPVHVHEETNQNWTHISAHHVEGMDVYSHTVLDNLWDPNLIPSAPLLSGARDDVQSILAVLEAEPPQWMPDSASFSCMQCATSFRPITCGRHHCRFCGGLFCRACSKGKCLLPSKFHERDPQRVCDTCYERLDPIQRILAERVSNAAQIATHDVTDLSCMRGWLNSPLGVSMEQEIYKATNSLRSYLQVGKLKSERSIPDAVLRGAKGLAIITVLKAGMMFTYKVGTGLVVARRSDGTWSAPSAITSFGIGWGAQAGGELTDFIIMLRTTKAVKAFSGRVHLSVGAGLSAAAGPVGRAAEADIRAGDGGAAACYTYSCSKGAFVGVSLEGNIVIVRPDTNSRFYGDPYLTPLDILFGSVRQPRAAASLYASLHDLFAKVEAQHLLRCR
ncbi:hypothetical protein O6H91_16G041600 [Diphasiastrum complanatum]|uniref:Uncharacterized protein n=6 Tax=Diphasiastrum complanatum TaxID=34168 RepID=A0ACC2BCP0_DIPCM|nr:hypothetical protein O6H91_16G041600 [Diphasiastrum complanatum]KAJ7527190.1 hypothetical protein O6H91_16G041600 [Diphasiastrum complanatum]KAJ7527191.1 hypothetical protein O6H91_16G041600 [Diphasiastrum complanatum]KAJ7527192.1 hypothetical protein O6H91_16G041600 [Diphasiastrum complanatum]KAJ7527193.1 hypothetical protein O6H91_16G041600 [Diphasiastrum complanatum]